MSRCMLLESVAAEGQALGPAPKPACLPLPCPLSQAIPGFKRYAMEHLGGEACVLGVLRSQPPLDPRDGATMTLLQVRLAALELGC